MNTNTLSYFHEIYTNGFIAESFSFLTFLVIVLGLLVITNKNPIVSVLFLIGLFACVAIYLILIGISFIGLSYLLVYVGAVSILFLFILMLINIRVSELSYNTTNGLPLAYIVSSLLAYPLYESLPYTFTMYNAALLQWYPIKTTINVNDLYNIVYVNPINWDGKLTEFTEISAIGNVMYTVCCIWLLITSIILLLAMVGAIVITIKQK